MNMYEPGSDGVSQPVEGTEKPITPEEVKARIRSLYANPATKLDDDALDKLLFGATCPAWEVEQFVHDYFTNILDSRYPYVPASSKNFAKAYLRVS